jgi:ParB-like chromosome segregation protein Spo0J
MARKPGKDGGDKAGIAQPVEMAPADLVSNPRNPRLHPEDQLDKLAASLKRFGQPRPIIARAENHMIIAGHGIHAAAARAGLATLKVVLWDDGGNGRTRP